VSYSNLTRSRILALCALAAAVTGAGATARAEAATPAITDWTAVSANTASGNLAGTSVSLSGTHVWNTPTSRVDGSWPYFGGPAFSPALPSTDEIQISGGPNYSYTLQFGGEVTNAILELGSLGSKITFPTGMSVTRLSGEPGFTVSGNTVSGTPDNKIGSSGNSDASGTVRINANNNQGFTSLTFTTVQNYTGPEDGILTQVLTDGTPPPPDNGCVTSDYDKTVDQLTQTAAEKAVFCLVNEQRKLNGLAPYTRNAILDQQARAHAQAAADIKWWTRDPVLAQQDAYNPHRNPLTKTWPADRIKGAGYCPSGAWSVGENATEDAGPGRPTPRNAVKWWLGSKLHHDAMLSATFKETGFGVVAASPVKGVTATPAGTFIETFGSCG
jgi:uncharacterized protein YkwD